jgi:hypothetical protein
LITSTFSEDSTLMAAGFSESYIRLWNLKGGKLTGIRTDFDSDDINDGSFESILSSFFGIYLRFLSCNSCCPQKPASQGWTYVSKTDRSFRSSLFPLFRSSSRSIGSTSLSSLRFSRFYHPIMVPRYVYEHSGLSWSSRTCMGRSMGSARNIFRFR